MIYLIAVLAQVFFNTSANAAPSRVGLPSEFIEEGTNKVQGAKEINKVREKLSESDFYNGSENFKRNMESFSDRVTPPGFILTRPINRLATIVGPSNESTAFKHGDTVYLRWTGAPGPRPGQQYLVFTPKIVLQDIYDPTQFSVRPPLDVTESISNQYRNAGYLYEGNGKIQITKITQGLVEAVVMGMNSPIAIGNEVMPVIPTVQKLERSPSGVQLAAAIVCGSPSDRISTMRRSFVYINRGSRDGMRVGRVLEAVESAKIEAFNPVGPEVSLGEAVVVHVTESFSTLMITKQFDVIRIGSLLKTKVFGVESDPKVIFSNYNKEKSKVKDPFYEDFKDIPEVPAVPKDKPILSELDELERSEQMRPLTENEKARLQRLSKQNQKGEGAKEAVDSLELLDKETDTPRLPQIDNSFKQGKESAKKDLKKKKKKKSNDEEELNLLMMQN